MWAPRISEPVASAPVRPEKSRLLERIASSSAPFSSRSAWYLATIAAWSASLDSNSFSRSDWSFSTPVSMPVWIELLMLSASRAFASAASWAALASACSAAFVSACFIAILAAVSSATCLANASKSIEEVLFSILISWSVDFSTLCGVSLAIFEEVSSSLARDWPARSTRLVKVFLNSLYSSTESNDFASEKVAAWLHGTETTDTSNNSASLIINPSVSLM